MDMRRGPKATSQVSIRCEFWKYGEYNLVAHVRGENHVPPHAQATSWTQSHAGADAFSRKTGGGLRCMRVVTT
jgi:hypothetical protein